MPTNIALVDGNNFYVCCERLFRPDLRKMAVPLHQVKDLVQQHDIQLFPQITLYMLIYPHALCTA